jgi:hypothetical protein
MRREVSYTHRTSVLMMSVQKMVEIVEHHHGHGMNDPTVYDPTIWVVEDDLTVEPPYPGIGVILTNGEPPVLPQGFAASRVKNPNDLRGAWCHDLDGECQIDDRTLGLFAPVPGGLQAFGY